MSYKRLIEGWPRAKKSLGQVFLVDADLAYTLIQKSGFKEGDRVLEIGPGRGILTAILLDKGIETVCCEIDQRMVKLLERRFGKMSNFRLINGDVLELDLETVFPNLKYKALGNIPYHLTSEILFKFFEYVKSCWDKDAAPLAESLIIMVQAEVGERILSSPGSRKWGVLPLYVNLFGEVEHLLDVPSTHFKPRPEVDSVVVRINFRSAYPFTINDFRLFKKVVKTAFGNRRKMLKNSLNGFLLPSDSKLNLQLRPESLNAADFAVLANALYENQNALKS